MLEERVVPQSEVIRAILLEDSPCCGSPAPASAFTARSARSPASAAAAAPAARAATSAPSTSSVRRAVAGLNKCFEHVLNKSL